ncbi:MAG: DoxX family protein [Polyangiaceae bacterium]|nr:DoxX family protein [Polyangiaceae bacterium]MCW5790143.1 DoxX family protein [Polyangiaceae bacterium]
MSWFKRLVAPPSPLGTDFALLSLRLWFGLAMAWAHGYGKITNLEGFTANVAKMGLPLSSVLGPAAALSEFVGALLIALGLMTRLSAAFLLITMVVAAFVVHAADPFQKKELALSYAVVMGALLVTGPGRFSVDARLGKR